MTMKEKGEMQLEEIFDQFEHLGNFKRAESIAGGHINSTYSIETDGNAPNYVLRKINSFVFRDIPSLIQNKVLVTEHLRKKAKESEKENIVQFVRAFKGDYYFKENENEYWDLMVFIPRSRIYLKVPSLSVALEAGRLFGDFSIC